MLGEKKGVTLALSCFKERPGSKIIFQMENCEEVRSYTQCSAILLPIVSQRFSRIQYNQSDLARNTLDWHGVLGWVNCTWKKFQVPVSKLAGSRNCQGEINTKKFQDRNKILWFKFPKKKTMVIFIVYITICNTLFSLYCIKLGDFKYILLKEMWWVYLRMWNGFQTECYKYLKG